MYRSEFELGLEKGPKGDGRENRTVWGMKFQFIRPPDGWKFNFFYTLHRPLRETDGRTSPEIQLANGTRRGGRGWGRGHLVTPLCPVGDTTVSSYDIVKITFAGTRRQNSDVRFLFWLEKYFSLQVIHFGHIVRMDESIRRAEHIEKVKIKMRGWEQRWARKTLLQQEKNKTRKEDLGTDGTAKKGRKGEIYMKL